MTMTRTEKAGHQDIIWNAKNSKIGATGVLFQSPTEIAKRDGRKRMTIKEYIEYRMGRNRGRLTTEIVREMWAEERRGRRKLVRK